MSCRLYKEAEKDLISMCDMQPGELAVLVDERTHEDSIVICVLEQGEKKFHILGHSYKTLGKEYTTAFNSEGLYWVRPLKEGELIEVKYSLGVKV